MNQYRYTAPADEKPLDIFPANGGYTSIFRTIACVGDSLSSGEFEIYYPKNNTTWKPAIMQNYGGTVTWKAN